MKKFDGILMYVGETANSNEYKSMNSHDPETVKVGLHSEKN
jgi:hypothetical protein